MAHLLPNQGLAVDLAGGSGAGAIFLASLGLSPVLVEVSEVALELAATNMAAAGRTATRGTTASGTATRRLQTVQLDLSSCTLAEALSVVATDVGPDGPPVAVVSCFHYLQRGLLQSVATDLPAGAIFACSIATVNNLERNERPSRRFLLEPGELKRLVVGRSDGETDLEVLHDHEGWNERAQHEAELLVRKMG